MLKKWCSSDGSPVRLFLCVWASMFAVAAVCMVVAVVLAYLTQ